MPARNSSMEISSPDPDAQNTTTRRKSTRVIKKPTLYSASSPIGSAKRKRTARDETDNGEAPDASEDEEDEVDESSEGEPDEEEVRETQRRRKSSTKKATPKKPAKKKTKTNGETVNLAIRPATAPKPRPKPKRTRKATAQDTGEATGIYADIFGGEKRLEDVADDWVKRFVDGQESAAVADLVNFVLKCSGCDLTVTGHDIEDSDGVTGRLESIQEEYQAQDVVDYPLISRAKGTSNFKKSIESFFGALIDAFHRAGLLFSRVELNDHILTWIGTLSSASNRPFRHTSTVVSLAVISALCDISKDVLGEAAQTTRQCETEKKKSRVNKERVKALEDKVRTATQNQETLDNFIKEWFDAVFLHRYRDVDYRIRMDCVQALGDWIVTYPDHFFDGQHLRYVGWLLSDSVGTMRLEVVKQLHRLFKDDNNIAGLRTFTERFRSRMVEMATGDSESNVRASAVELLDILREAGLLEPDDVDAVGKLIFDAEPKVRKAVVRFFAQNISDVYDSKIDDLGGQEALDEGLNISEGEEAFDKPRPEWLKLKCLAEVLNAYDAEEELPSAPEDQSTRAGYLIIGPGLETRFSLAAQALYDEIDEIKNWKILGGYLLYDHSGTIQNGTSDNVELNLRQECKLNEREVQILLEILNASVKLDFAQADETHREKKSKQTKAQKQELQENLEDSTRHLATIIPQLLKKFGATPETASAVLRLEPVLNLEVFQDLRQETTDFAAHLDDINKQLLTHGSESVATEASAALLHARRHEDLGEITEAKVQSLWEDSISALHALKTGRDLSVRGNLSPEILTTVSNIALRIDNLSRVSNCVEYLDQIPVPAATNKRSKSASQSQTEQVDAFAILLSILNRGNPGEEVDPEIDAQEDVLVFHAATVFTFYFLWQIKSWSAQLAAGRSMSDANVEYLVEKRDALVTTIQRVIRSRQGSDSLRIHLASVLLDILTVSPTLRTVTIKTTPNTEPSTAHLDFIIPAPAKVQETLQHILIAAEKTFAKKSNRKLDVATDDDPVDLDDDPESSSDEADDDDNEPAAHEAKKTAILVAERQLCEFASKLVLGIVGGVLDDQTKGRAAGPIRKLLEKNRSKLGKNYTEVVAFLDDKAAGKKAARARSKTPAVAKGKAAAAKSKEIVVESDDEDEIEDEEDPRNDREADEDVLAQEEEDAAEEAREREGPPDEEMVDAEDEVESVLGD